jgi:hypothetical protein
MKVNPVLTLFKCSETFDASRLPHIRLVTHRRGPYIHQKFPGNQVLAFKPLICLQLKPFRLLFRWSLLLLAFHSNSRGMQSCVDLAAASDDRRSQVKLRQEYERALEGYRNLINPISHNYAMVGIDARSSGS